jgi:hypothetical protein
VNGNLGLIRLVIDMENWGDVMKRINEISGPVKKGISLPLVVTQLLHMKSAILSRKIRMRFLYANRPSTDDKSHFTGF